MLICWFLAGLSIEDRVPDDSAFSRARNERFGDSAIFRSVFERVVGTCIAADLVGGEGFAVDASLIEAKRQQASSIPGTQWPEDIDAVQARRAVKEYLATLDESAYGAASDVTPKFVSPSDPAAQWTGALRNAAFFAYGNNYLIAVKFGIIMEVEASARHPAAEVGASRTMIEPDLRLLLHQAHMARGRHRLRFRPPISIGWSTQQGIAPHVPVIDKSQREDGTFSREDFIYDEMRDVTMPGRQDAGHDGPCQRRSRASLSRLRAKVPRLPA